MLVTVIPTIKLIDPASVTLAAWYDPSDLSTLFQDSAGTTPVTADGDPVGLMQDKSGNGHHLTQATAASRPLYKVDSSGNPYLLFDGTDDWLKVGSPAMSLPWHRISAVRMITHTNGDLIFAEGSGAGAGRLRQQTPSPTVAVFDGGAGYVAANTELAVGSNGVVTERHDGANSGLAINNGVYTTGDPGTVAATGCAIGASPAGSVPSNIRFYGCVTANGALADDEILGLRAWLAEKAGVTL